MIYKDDKARTKNTFGWTTFFLLTLYSITIWIQTYSNTAAQELYGMPLKNISFLHMWLWLGMGLLLFRTSKDVFLIRENNRFSFLMRKYDMLPVTWRDQFLQKTGLMLTYMLYYLLYTLFAYIFALVGTSYDCFSIPKILLEVLLFIALSLLALALVLLFYWIANRKSAARY